MTKYDNLLEIWIYKLALVNFGSIISGAHASFKVGHVGMHYPLEGE